MEKPKIIFENAEFVILDKPALLDSQNSKESRYSVVDFLKEKFNFSGLVHRLDFGTSGLMLAAKTPESAEKYTNLMQKQKIKRHYKALVMKRVENETGEIKSSIEDKPAHTKFKVLERFANATLVEVELLTGRKHQIRRHFAEIGHPLLGDHLYKQKGSDRLFHRPALHAFMLQVEEQVFTINFPDDLNQLIKRLKNI